jgi:hypothetical protein
MALDHYVSQVHLRNFYSPALGERMYAIRKSDGKAFTPNSESVCRIEDGNTNAYLMQDRHIEEFLKTIEPKYNSAIQRLAAGTVDPECVFVIAGFAAYVATCSPAGMRIQAAPMKAMLDSTARALDAVRGFPRPPEALGGASLTELLDSQKLKISVDPKFPQAIGIINILKMTAMFGNFAWDILRNPFDDSPFFTSDFPLAIEESANPRVLNRICPLSPTLAVRIRPDVSLKREECDFDFAHFRSRLQDPSRQEVLVLNRLWVQCAEDLVFYRDDRPWVKPFVAKYSRYQIEALTQEFGSPKSALLVSRQRIVERADPVSDSER